MSNIDLKMITNLLEQVKKLSKELEALPKQEGNIEYINKSSMLLGLLQSMNWEANILLQELQTNIKNTLNTGCTNELDMLDKIKMTFFTGPTQESLLPTEESLFTKTKKEKN